MLSRQELINKFANEMGWGDPSNWQEQTNSIFSFLYDSGSQCYSNSVVLDISAGQCRYKPFFQHGQYISIDSTIGDTSWDYSRLDLIGDSMKLPVQDETIDVCLNFTSLEHYAEPDKVFTEFARILKPGGRLFLYVPFIQVEHQIPYDYYRYTRYGLSYLCSKHALEIDFIRPTNSILETASNILYTAINVINNSDDRSNLLKAYSEIDKIFNRYKLSGNLSVDWPKETMFPQIPVCYCLSAHKTGILKKSVLYKVKKELLKSITACPDCKGNLKWFTDHLICSACDKIYNFQNGIPCLIEGHGKDNKNYVNENIAAMIENKPANILSVGYNTEPFRDYIKNKYPLCNYIAVEINKEMIDKVSEEIDIISTDDIEKINLKNYSLKEKHFDYIIYNDLLQKLYDPWTVINEHKQFLKDDGFIIFNIYNIRNLEILKHLIDGNWAYVNDGILNVTNLRFFTLKEIGDWFSKCGYEIVDIKYSLSNLLDLNNIPDNINIDLDRFTIKNVSKEEAREFLATQFTVKAKKLVFKDEYKLDIERFEKLLNEGNLKDGSSLLTNLMAKYPESPDLLTLQGELNIASVNYSEDIQELQNLYNSGDLIVTSQFLSILIDKYPASPELLNLQGELNFQMGNKEEAKNLFMILIERWPDHRSALNNLGVIFWEEHDTVKALEYFTEALRVNHEDRCAISNLGSILITLKRNREAKELYSSYLQKHPDDEDFVKALEDLNKVETNLDVSIIIPVFNNLEYTQRCLKCLYEHRGYNFSCEVIIVDNDSSDGTKEFLEYATCLYQNLSVLRNDENLLFARACNQGARIARGKYLVFLNNDTEPETGWLEAGIRRLESSNNIGIVGAKLLYPDRSVQHCGIEMVPTQSQYRLWPNHRYRYAGEHDPCVNQPEEVMAVTGACLFIETDLFMELNGFTEDYGMYFEDIDLCFKVRRAGKKIFYEPLCVIIHYEGKSSPEQHIIDNLNLKAASIFFTRWKKEIFDLDSDRKIMATTSFQQDQSVEKPEKGDVLQRVMVKTLQPILWLAPFFNPSGYTSEAFAFIKGLVNKVNINIANISNIYSKEFIDGLTPELKTILNTRIIENIYVSNNAVIYHCPAYGFIKHPYSYTIGRTMFETDRLPSDWVDKCNIMDEIWVPSEFNFNTFHEAGVKKEKLLIIPEPVDIDFFNPDKVNPYGIIDKARFNFLSMFEWSERKGWDILLEGYFREFTRKDDVCLFLKTYLLHKPDRDVKKELKEKIISFARSLNLEIDKLPEFHLLTHQIPFKELPSFYKAFDCLVIPSHGEGWGRPHCEAMSMELPVIATNWSGNTEFMKDDNSYLIDVEDLVEIKDMEISFYQGHKWAKASVSHLRKLMRHVFENPELAKEKGRKARRDMISTYSCEVIGNMVSDRLKEIQEIIAKNHNKLISPINPRIYWEGSQFVYHSLALINRELCLQLIDRGYDVTVIPYENHQFKADVDKRFHKISERMTTSLSSPADIHVRHQWPPKFTAPPAGGHWVIIQPWEYGSLDRDWVEPMRDLVDEIWIPSHHVRKTYINSGIQPEKVFVIPNGFNPEIFNPSVSPITLKTDKKFKFLFVGGTIWRKGVDLLINTYVKLFKPEDDVVLIIKDMGKDSFYKGLGAGEKIKEIQNNPSMPSVIYLDRFLTEKEMAGLYTACDCLVHPYRGEGFAFPVLEAMACGKPVIVTSGGATDDFCKTEFTFHVSAEWIKIKFPDMEFAGGEGIVLEPSMDSLAKHMREVYENYSSATEKAAKALEFVRENYTWDKIGDLLVERINKLMTGPVLRYEKIKDMIKKGENFFTEGNMDEAIKCFTMVIEIEPACGKAHSHMATIYWKRNDRAKALNHIKEAIKNSPYDADVVWNYGHIMTERGQKSEAFKAYKDYLSKNPHDEEIKSLFDKLVKEEDRRKSSSIEKKKKKKKGK